MRKPTTVLISGASQTDLKAWLPRYGITCCLPVTRVQIADLVRFAPALASSLLVMVNYEEESLVNVRTQWRFATSLDSIRAADQPGRDRNIKLPIAVDVRALDFGRTCCGNTLTHHGR